MDKARQTTPPPPFLSNIEADLAEVNKAVIGSKIQEQQVFQQSGADGGPTNYHQALWNMMDLCKITVATLAKRTNTPKKRITKVVNGEVEDQKVMIKIINVLQRIRPDLIK